MKGQFERDFVLLEHDVRHYPLFLFGQDAEPVIWLLLLFDVVEDLEGKAILDSHRRNNEDVNAAFNLTCLRVFHDRIPVALLDEAGLALLSELPFQMS